MKKAIFRFHVDYGRQGDLDGVFISTQQRVDLLTESGFEVYFGEVLGKHSEVYGVIDSRDITFLTDKEEVVAAVEEFGLTSGHSPFWYPIHDTDLGAFETAGEYVDKLIELEIKN